MDEQSTPSETPAESLPANDEIAASSPATETTTDANSGKSMLDFVKESLKQSDTTEASQATETKAEEPAESDAQNLGETKKEEEVTSAKEEPTGETKEEKQEDTKGPVPYERFEEVNTKYRNLETEAIQLRDYAKHHQGIIDYCSKYNITNDQFGKVLEIQGLINTNPAEALKRIMPIVEAIQGFTGDKLPPDLQSRVDKGTLELPDAREIASLRAQAQFGTNRFDQYQKKMEEDRQSALTNSLASANIEWTNAKKKADPDFKPKANDNLPDGKYEMVYNKMTALIGEQKNGQFVNVIKTPADMTALLERAYQSVDASLAPFRSRPATRKPLIQNGSSINRAKNEEDAKTMREEVGIAAARHGLSF